MQPQKTRMGLGQHHRERVKHVSQANSCLWSSLQNLREDCWVTAGHTETLRGSKHLSTAERGRSGLIIADASWTIAVVALAESAVPEFAASLVHCMKMLTLPCNVMCGTRTKRLSAIA